MFWNKKKSTKKTTEPEMIVLSEEGLDRLVNRCRHRLEAAACSRGECLPQIGRKLPPTLAVKSLGVELAIGRLRLETIIHSASGMDIVESKEGLGARTGNMALSRKMRHLQMQLDNLELKKRTANSDKMVTRSITFHLRSLYIQVDGLFLPLGPCHGQLQMSLEPPPANASIIPTRVRLQILESKYARFGHIKMGGIAFLRVLVSRPLSPS